MNNKKKNKKVFGIILIVLGVGSIIAGTIMLNSPKKDIYTVDLTTEKNVEPTLQDVPGSTPIVSAETQVQENTEQVDVSETEQSAVALHSEEIEVMDTAPVEDDNVAPVNSTDESYEKGLEFEKFVVKGFNRKYWTIKDWRGDKGVDGMYAESNTYPDLEMRLKTKSTSCVVAVECKWRSAADRSGNIKISYPEQLKRYKAYANDSGIPVFIFLGLGGSPDNPDKLYIVPLSMLSSPKIKLEELGKFENKTKTNFYFDTKAKTFRRE